MELAFEAIFRQFMAEYRPLEWLDSIGKRRISSASSDRLTYSSRFKLWKREVKNKKGLIRGGIEVDQSPIGVNNKIFVSFFWKTNLGYLKWNQYDDLIAKRIPIILWKNK